MPELDALRQQVTVMAQDNALTRFDYRDKTGNKNARSHVAKLRTFKADVERARVKLKADALAYGKRVDTAAGDLTKLVEDMIDVHAAPLLAIETEEKERKALLEATVDRLRRSSMGLALVTGQPLTHSASLAELLTDAEAVDPATFGDAAAQVAEARSFAIAKLGERIAAAKQAEADAAELVRLRAETAAREKREKEEAEAKAEKERQEQDERERLAKVEQDRIAAEEAEAQRERDRLAREEEVRQEAAEKAAQEERNRIAAEQKRRDDEAAAEAKRLQAAHDAEVQRVKDAAAKEAEELRLKNEESARQQKAAADLLAKELQEKKDKEAREQEAADNAKRRIVVHNRIRDDIGLQAGIDISVANAVVQLIAAGKVRHLAITYTDMP
jgi:hypothetical protein